MIDRMNAPDRPTIEQRNFTQIAGLNNATFNDYYERLKLLALSMFEWQGLPETCSARFLEKVLFENGLACFVFDETFGLVTLKCTPSAELNIYDDAIAYQVYSNTYTGKSYPLSEIVLVRNNLLNRATCHTVELFAWRLANVERTIDTNLNAQKTPVLIRSTEETRLTMKNAYMKYDGNMPFIFGDKKFSPEDNFKVLKTDAPYIVDKLSAHKRNLWAECLSFFGVNNVATEKGERLITDEVTANNEQIALSAETMLATRQFAAKQLNEMYPGLNVTVKLRSTSDANGDITNGSERGAGDEEQEGAE